MAERFDYSWNDQDPDQIQSWHEFQGSSVGPVGMEAITSSREDEKNEIDEETSDLLTNFQDWLDENFSEMEVDILLSMPTGERLHTVDASHIDIKRLMGTYELSLSRLLKINHRLRQEVRVKLDSAGLAEVFPWRAHPYSGPWGTR